VRQSKKSEGLFEMELAGAQLALLSYIAKLLGELQDAHDVLQETNLTLCRERADFDPDRPFLAWARTVAYYAVMTWRKRQVRSRLVFSDQTVALMAEGLACDTDPVDERLVLLEACKKKLTQVMRDIIDSYYGHGERLATIGARLGRTEGSLANSLYHIRGLLKKCVEERLAQTERCL